MSIDQKVRVALLLASVTVSFAAAFAAAHGIYLASLDGIGGTGH